jgi:phosphoribosylformylglycinamidine synthase
MRLRKTRKALAMTTDCNARYCYIDPRMGGRSAVAEAARNIVCSGGKPLAVTNCLNFGNPYKPEIYYGFAEAVGGMGDACRVFDTPVTGGNVSFYNEDPERAVFPTPVIGMIGLIEDTDQITTQWFKDESDAILLIGTNKDELGASEYLHTIYNENVGAVPELDLEFEQLMQQTLLSAIKSGLIKSAHDSSDGGLAVALAECCISERDNQIGAEISIDDKLRIDCLLFGESQSRVIISCDKNDVDKLLEHFNINDVRCKKIGQVGGKQFKFNDLIDLPLTDLNEAFFDAMHNRMEKVS